MVRKEEAASGRKKLISKKERRKLIEETKTERLRISADPDKTKRQIVWGVGIFLGVVFLILCLLSFPFVVKEEYKDTYDNMDDTQTRLYMREGVADVNISINTTGFWLKDEVVIDWHTYLMLAFITSVGPISFYEVGRRKKIDKLEERLADFLRDISESMRAGQTLHEAIRTSSNGEYGLLTPEIKKMAMQVSWGVSATKALDSFAKRVSTPLVKRSVTLINEAASAGGNISNVIDAAAKDTREMHVMKVTRATEMGIYKIVIGVSYAVFLVVVAIIFFTFMPQMEKLGESYDTADQGASAQPPGGFDPSSVDFMEVKLLFFAAVAIQAIGDGVVAGIMATGRIRDGLWLATIFSLITVLAFDLVLL